MPVFHGLHRCLALQGRLRQLVVVQRHVAQQRLLQILSIQKSMCLEYISNPPVKALYHSIGLGRPGPSQPVLYAELLAQPIKLMVATGHLLPAGKQAIGEFLAIVRE